MANLSGTPHTWSIDNINPAASRLERLHIRRMKSSHLHQHSYKENTCQNTVPFGGSAGNNQELPTYEDLGDRIYICPDCGAKMWYDERLRKHRNENPPRFGMCCLQGKVQLPTFQDPPVQLFNLLAGHHPQSNHFRMHVRTYNMMFAFTSMGGKIDRNVNDGRAPYVYKLSGQNMHLIGSILPTDGATPKFAQLYIYDTSNEVANRISATSGDSSTSSLVDISLVQMLQDMLDEHNKLVKVFRRARDYIHAHEGQTIKIRLMHRRGRNVRQYDMPTSENEIAALIVGDIGSTEYGRDIIVQYKTGLLHRIHENHPDFLPLQYPLLFPYGEGGYDEKIPHVVRGEAPVAKITYVSMREYFAYMIQDRNTEYSSILHGGKLFQQFVVDAYTMIESYRLTFIRNNQQQLRAEMYKGLTDALLLGETDAAARGKRIILPSSFTGGARYIMNNYQDAIAICNWAGYPQLFITFTCNPKWPEITRALEEEDLRLEDRPDFLTRVFKMKLEHLMQDLKKGDIFGPIKAALYTIEFQKRGLPHAHIVLFLANQSYLDSPQEIDRVISAEIPDKNEQPELFEAVSNYMMHGPCGLANPKSPCMVNGKCSKYYPKPFNSSTIIHEDGYPRYKRLNNGQYILKNGVPLDNRSVIPYNPTLLLKYQAHLNVERCKHGESIKYLFKYVSKGHDRATIAFYGESSSGEREVVHDEIKMYYDVRYLSPCEAVWRIFGFDINYRTPSVERLSFHLPNQQTIIYADEANLDDVVNHNEGKPTMFQAWMRANEKYDEARALTYSEFPTKFVFKKPGHYWDFRKTGFSIGRICYVPPGTGEAFYLRMLLATVKGPRSFEELRTVDDVLHPTFRDACYALGLLEDDKEYVDAIQEANQWATPNYLRRLFCTLLLCNCISRPEIVWQQSWKLMAEDILYSQQQLTGHPGLSLSDAELQDHALHKIEDLLQLNGRSLQDYPTMPYPARSLNVSAVNKLVLAELDFDRNVLKEQLHVFLRNLTEEQSTIYTTIIDTVHNVRGGLYFVYGYGGTGKTYLWQTLCASLRSEGRIVLTVASSGIASLLLPNGKTAHSQFAIPLAITEDSVCNIKQGTPLAELLIQASLIMWDEAPMANRHCFEALDRTLRDIIRRNDPNAIGKPFGGKTVVLGGDFRQILPVIPRGGREDIVFATINASYLWNECTVFTLTKNMRLTKGHYTDDVDAVTKFSEWIISVGDGNVDIEPDTEDVITIPRDLLLFPLGNPMDCIIDSTYPSLVDRLGDGSYFRDRAILTATLSVVYELNSYMLAKLPGEEVNYLSADSVCKSDGANSSIAEIHSVEFLNTITMSGLPNHKLSLKVGAPIMLMRNIDKSIGLCNGTRLIVTRLEKHVIGAEIITGSNTGMHVLIPRLTITPSETSLPFTLCRRQFPVMLSFVMTINKSQGQSLLNVGLFLPRPVFTHGQLYVAISRVRRREGLKILLLDDKGTPTNKTSNVVYKEVFCNLLN
ncbi:uncharacterized protein LOC114732794 [Neltuma alba]|uniref:uncharacterized protein LOC114732794 n=1 Tax=Neltuma alba TaxID=207710 RepID=UPI0010A4F3B3|nr:uncharacterized protein LOC114732794 [Prosopis alba]